MTLAVDTIIQRVRDGDTGAFAEIVDHYQRDIWRIVAFAIRDHNPHSSPDDPFAAYLDGAEDLAQQVFINAFLHLDQFDTQQDMGIWLRSIARNIVRNELRRAGREAGRLRRYHQWMARRFEADEQTGVDEMQQWLEECRRRLSPEFAHALEMRYERAMSFTEIAEALGRTLEATRQMLSRIRTSLRHCVEERRTLQ